MRKIMRIGSGVVPFSSTRLSKLQTQVWTSAGALMIKKNEKNSKEKAAKAGFLIISLIPAFVILSKS